MTAGADPGEISVEHGAALDNAAERLASSICEAAATDPARARFVPLIWSLTVIGFGVSAFLARWRRTRATRTALPAPRASFGSNDALPRSALLRLQRRAS